MLIMKTVSRLLIVLLTVSERSSSMKVVGRAGENITLPCKYDIRYNGATSVCWGRGSIPLSGCNKQIISTDGRKVIESTRVPSRYQLLGRLEDGDVSLTILNTTEEDAGLYGCRVQIPGWFNDEKHHIDLIIEKVNPPASTTAATTTERGSQVTLVEELWSTPAQQVTNLPVFIGNTVRLFIVFLIPALLLIAAYRVWRTNQSTATDRRQNQSEERDSSV
ncbi:T-cell immunoglobulin and mucin domain-containing protein 4-like isoform X2 [Thunnus albacares]|uniref:T-cell immunoglobulin and mucin domain-containing protein 4-like isoform X2 n=1 Tax=Thunnus albacares TaxID=8236 RepID=UPI001CF698FF|nr:T-cell immunoglobulin and mucin domain-containing protein 4-like isoform X2 [Thunnus albacares]